MVVLCFLILLSCFQRVLFLSLGSQLKQGTVHNNDNNVSLLSVFLRFSLQFFISTNQHGTDTTVSHIYYIDVL